MLCCWRTCDRSLPRAWLALQILELISLSRELSLEITLPRYLNSSTVFNSVSSMVMEGRRPVESGDGWNSTSVSPRLMVSPKRRDASANLSTMRWRADSVCAMRAQASANRASRMSFSIVFVLALRRRRSKRDPSNRYIKGTLHLRCL